MEDRPDDLRERINESNALRVLASWGAWAYVAGVVAVWVRLS
jgi:hypothetical protein